MCGYISSGRKCCRLRIATLTASDYREEAWMINLPLYAIGSVAGLGPRPRPSARPRSQSEQYGTAVSVARRVAPTG